MGNAQQVEFSAVCRWAKVKGIRRKYLVSGFEISKISNDDRERFLELLQWFHFENPDDDFIADTSLTTDQFFYGDTVAQAGGGIFQERFMKRTYWTWSNSCCSIIKKLF